MKDEKLFTDRLKHVLDEQAALLDSKTLNRLRQARLQAVNRVEHKHRQYWKPVTAFALSALLLLAIVFWPQQPGIDNFTTSIEDLDLLVADDSLQLYEELEFYQWLLVSETDAG